MADKVRHRLAAAGRSAGDAIDAVGGVMARVELREILTQGDRRAVLGLRRGPGQEAYLDSMEDIFLEAEEEARGDAAPMGRA